MAKQVSLESQLLPFLPGLGSQRLLCFFDAEIGDFVAQGFQFALALELMFGSVGSESFSHGSGGGIGWGIDLPLRTALVTNSKGWAYIKRSGPGED